MDQLMIRLGTSAFTAAGWEGSFYPQGMKPADYLSYYAKHFNSVELDNTFYRAPSKAVVEGWARKTPDSFVFAAKVPQVITHEKVLVDCDADFQQFVETMDALGNKLGPLLFQFGYFNKNAFTGVNDFLARLRPFLKKLPADHKFAVEIRNKNWLVPQFADALRERGVALALIDQSWMPRPAQWFEKLDPITAKVWDKVIVDRRAELSEWADILGKVRKRKIQIFAYANNHYAGHGPATVEMFRGLLQA
jgi:uncharacterized protein YecE (DUF72 family)